MAVRNREREYEFNVYGDRIPIPDTTGMLVPVQCNRCGKVYDLTNTEVIHRYGDCTVFKTPCCGLQVDDRSWVSLPAFTRLRQ